ncbi:hypothetical protein [Micromonospora sp. KC721]|uniref:hypothetical protein n=1 Tax=Micromonospora sp. KC721 TaxID=2530380 RepID=UPI001FB71D1C|nr:hypothetical protein [Micromonospora sp. KC721]
MRTATAATTGWWARLLLLAVTLLGLAAMHTIGHGTHAGGQPSGHAAADHADRHLPVAALPGTATGADTPGGVDCAGAACRHAAALPGTARFAVDAGVDCAGTGCRPPVVLPAGDRGAAPSGWSVCLAVLAAITVAVLLAVLLRARRRPGVGVRRPTVRPPGPGAPPGRPVGLRLATVAVLRR